MSYATFYYLRRLADNIKNIDFLPVLIFLFILVLIGSITVMLLNVMSEPYNLCRSQNYEGEIELDNLCPLGEGFLGCEKTLIIVCADLDERQGKAINDIQNAMIGKSLQNVTFRSGH